MENLSKLSHNSPIYPKSQKLQYKKSPPKLVSLKESIFVSIKRKPIYTKLKNESINISFPSQSPQKFPQLRPIYTNNLKRESRNFHYSKWIPKVQLFKPVLHDRTKSHGNPSDDDEDYFEMKEKLDLLNY